jgi:uncharacterized lipoprotein YmbA
MRATSTRLCAAAALATTLAACSSPQAPRYHTLLPAPGEIAALPAPAAPLSASWELLPVRIPPQVDQPQFVVRAGDDTMALLEQERWVAPLQSEIKAALAQELARDLGTGDGVKLASQQTKKPWRIRVDLQRFDSVPGRYARVEATWQLTSGEAGTVPISCSSAFQEPAQEGYPALSAAHRKATVELGDVIATTLRTLDATGAANCPPPNR